MARSDTQGLDTLSSAGERTVPSPERPARVYVRKDKTNPRRLAYLTLLLFAEPPSWPWVVIGACLIMAAVALHGWAAGYLARAGYAEREKILTVRGPYRYNRNPYYVAQMIMDFGFFLIAGRPLLFLIYFPIIFSVYRYWVRKEESFLENEFGDDYRTLKREVPRWSFRLKPAPARGSQLSFRWAIFKLNRELPRALSHLGLMLIFIGYFFLGNPFEAVSPLGRITIIAAVAVWLVIHDIYPLQPIEKSLAWVLLALACAVFAIVFLICGLVWQPWTGASAWISIVAGGLLGLLVAGDSVAQWHGRPIKQTRKFFAAPVRQLYGIALAFGLISCTLGGVWLAITTALVIWLLCVGGILPASSARPAYS